MEGGRNLYLQDIDRKKLVPVTYVEPFKVGISLLGGDYPRIRLHTANSNSITLDLPDYVIADLHGWTSREMFRINRKYHEEGGRVQ